MKNILTQKFVLSFIGLVLIIVIGWYSQTRSISESREPEVRLNGASNSADPIEVGRDAQENTAIPEQEYETMPNKQNIILPGRQEEEVQRLIAQIKEKTNQIKVMSVEYESLLEDKAKRTIKEQEIRKKMQEHNELVLQLNALQSE